MTTTLRTFFEQFFRSTCDDPDSELSTLSSRDFTSLVNRLYDSVDTAANDLCVTREEMTLYALGRAPLPLRIERRLRWKVRQRTTV